MKNYITAAIFDTNAEGKRTIQTWVYSALFTLCVVTGLLAVLPALGRRSAPPDNKREVRLSVQVPSAIQVVTRNGELELVEIIQKPTEPAAPEPSSKKPGQGGQKPGNRPCPPCPGGVGMCPQAMPGGPHPAGAWSNSPWAGKTFVGGPAALPTGNRPCPSEMLPVPVAPNNSGWGQPPCAKPQNPAER